MAIDPRIALAGTPVNIPQPDFLRTLLGASQLQGQEQQRVMQQLQLQRLLQGEQRQRALADYMARTTGGGGPVAPAQPLAPALQPGTAGAPLPAPYQGPQGPQVEGAVPGQVPPGPALPDQAPREAFNLGRAMQIGGPEALPFLKEYRAAQHEEMLGRRAGFEAEKSQLDAASKKLEYLGGITGTVRDQATLDLARQDVAQRAPGMERFFPAQYEPSQWAQFRHGLQTRKEQVAQAQAQERLGIEQQQAEIAQGRLGTEQRQTSVAEQRVAIERLQAEIAARKLDEFEYKDTPQGLVAVPKYGQPGGATTPQTVTTGSFERNRQELALHKEYNDRSKNYQEVRDAMGNIRASGASPTPAGDLSLVYAYIKMLDQRTGVRNEETRMAASTGGLPAEAQRWVEWAKGNQLLPDSVRKDFLERSSMLYDQYTKEYGDLARQYKEVATRQGLNPANVVLEYGTTTRRQAPTGVVTNADIDKTLANPANEGKSRQDIIEAFRTKGYRVPGD